MDNDLPWRYFYHDESETLIHTQSPKLAVDIFMDGANEIDFITWVTGAMQHGSTEA